MQALAAIGMGAFFVVGLVVGLRLVAMWRRTRGWPELLIGVGLLCYGPLSFPPAVVGLRLLESQPAWGAALLGYAVCVMAVAGTTTALLTYRVFRPRSTPARLATIGVGLTLFGCWAATATSSGFDFRGRGIDAPGYAAFVLRSVVLGWAAAESLRYWGLMRRRLGLGLADAVTTNRFLLWGVGIGCGSLTSFTALLAITRTPGQLAITDATSGVISVLGLVSAAALFLAFLPPGRYRRYLEARAALRATL